MNEEIVPSLLPGMLISSNGSCIIGKQEMLTETRGTAPNTLWESILMEGGRKCEQTLFIAQAWSALLVTSASLSALNWKPRSYFMLSAQFPLWKETRDV